MAETPVQPHEPHQEPLAVSRRLVSEPGPLCSGSRRTGPHPPLPSPSHCSRRRSRWAASWVGCSRSSHHPRFCRPGASWRSGPWAGAVPACSRSGCTQGSRGSWSCCPPCSTACTSGQGKATGSWGDDPATQQHKAECAFEVERHCVQQEAALLRPPRRAPSPTRPRGILRGSEKAASWRTGSSSQKHSTQAARALGQLCQAPQGPWIVPALLGSATCRAGPLSPVLGEKWQGS